MSTPVTLPALGESVTEGTIVRWLKRVGDSVAIDEPLLEVATDKVDTEIPSPASGVVLEIAVSEDEVVAVGGLLAVIGVATPAAPPAPVPAVPRAVAAPAVPAVSSVRAATPIAFGGKAPKTPEQHWASIASASTSAYLSPLVRKIASERGLDLATVRGTGGSGRIRKQDLPPLATTQSGQPTVGRPPSVSHQFTQLIEVDVSALSRIHRGEGPSRIVYRQEFARAVDEALANHPSLRNGMAPASDLGEFGSLVDLPVVPAGSVAAVGWGAVVKRAVVIDDVRIGETIAVRSVAQLALAYDPRAVSSADAGEFLAGVRTALESAGTRS